MYWCRRGDVAARSSEQGQGLGRRPRAKARRLRAKGREPRAADATRAKGRDLKAEGQEPRTKGGGPRAEGRGQRAERQGPRAKSRGSGTPRRDASPATPGGREAQLPLERRPPTHDPRVARDRSRGIARTIPNWSWQWPFYLFLFYGYFCFLKPNHPTPNQQPINVKRSRRTRANAGEQSGKAGQDVRTTMYGGHATRHE